MALIMAAHEIPYVATASISYPEDYMRKVKKAMEIDRPSYIHLHQPCTTGWRFPPSKTIEVGRLAVESGAWLLYEIENGEFRITYRPVERRPVKEYLKMQGRFKHLTDEEIQKIQDYIDEVCSKLRI